MGWVVGWVGRLFGGLVGRWAGWWVGVGCMCRWVGGSASSGGVYGGARLSFLYAQSLLMI